MQSVSLCILWCVHLDVLFLFQLKIEKGEFFDYKVENAIKQRS